MGAFKKGVRSNVRISTRIVLENYMREKGIAVDKAKINQMVKKVEESVTPEIMNRLRNG